MGLVAAVVAGWLGIFAPLSSVLDEITFIGFVAFFAFLVCMGITILRRSEPGPEAARAGAS